MFEEVKNINKRWKINHGLGVVRVVVCPRSLLWLVIAEASVLPSVLTLQPKLIPFMLFGRVNWSALQAMVINHPLQPVLSCELGKLGSLAYPERQQHFSLAIH